jgi:hypothetical protein
VLVTDAEPRDRGVIGHLVAGDHPKRDVVAATPLDPARRAHPDRIRINEQGNHHLRIVRRGTPPVAAIGPIERIEIQLRHRLQHEPRQMVLGQPLPQRRRQQQLLITITRDEVLGHAGIVQTPPDSPGLCDTLRAKRQWPRSWSGLAVVGPSPSHADLDG